jgi:two-component system cell cycle sensor histidine kinase/response regulator CckA
MRTDIRSSLKRRLPLVLSAVLCVTLIGVCVGAYIQLRRQLTRSAGDRVLAASRQVKDMLDGQVWRIRTEGRQLAATPEVAAVLARPTDASVRRLHLHYFGPGAAAGSRLRAISIFDRNGRLLGGADTAGSSLGAHALAFQLESPSAQQQPLMPGVTPLSEVNGIVEYRTIDPLVSVKGDTLGYAVLQSVVADTAGARRINGLIGSGAELLLGNSSGTLWTDTRHRVMGPTDKLDSARSVEYSDEHGEKYVGAQLNLSGAPWSVLVQMPYDRAMQPARSFLLTVLGIALLLFLVGAVAAWLLSRQITEPLSNFTDAATEFASGDYARRIPVNRTDELGSMAIAFNEMAAKIQASVCEREQHKRSLEAANAELQESELRYRQLVELSPDGIMLHRDGVIDFANAAMATLLGARTGKDLIGTSLLDLVPAERHEVSSARIRRIQDGDERLRQIEQTLRRLDGSEIQVETIAMRFIADGRPNVLSIVRDVSSRKRLEEQLRQAQKMEAVGQLAGGVAHDFNNILTIIIAYGHLLRTTRASDEALQHDLGEILGAGERAAALTRQLLAFSRRQLLQPSVVDLSQLTRDLEKMLSRLLPENIELVTNLAKPLGFVNADSGQIEQVIMNLVVNARDAMPDGGRLVIETADVELEAYSPVLPSGSHGGEFVMLSVSDNGHGMDEATRLKIFDPFFTTKEAGKGTGLGLSTVYGIIQQSGGSISTTSAIDVGTTFRVFLPRVYATPAVQAPKRDRPEISCSETILLVEDDERVRRAAERVLRSRGYTVIVATNGVHALDVAGQYAGTIDLAITDLVMPVMGGRELARELACVRPDTKILCMSGYTEDAASQASLLNPGVVFLSKPFTPDALAEKVRETLSAGVTVMV